MNNLIINSLTNKIIKSSLSKPSHAYLFIGPSGLGKTTIAKDFARNLLGAKASDGDLERWILLVEPIESKKISITQMAALKDFANQTKPEVVNNKVIIIDQADRMSIEASNSLLLLLEEPPPATVIILVADNSANLPKTILSRAQMIKFYPPKASQMQELCVAQGLDGKVAKVIGNYPAKVLAYAGNNYQYIGELIDKAEKFINGEIKDRLLIVAAITEKKEVLDFLNVLARLLERPDSDFFSVKQGESLINAQLHLYNNGNPRFVMEELALEFA